MPELTWMFFLRYLDIIEEKEEQKAKALGVSYSEMLKAPYRWRDWAAPFDKTINCDEMIQKKKFDLKATNDNAPDYSDKRTTSELMAIIQDSQKQIEDGLKQLQK